MRDFCREWQECVKISAVRQRAVTGSCATAGRNEAEDGGDRRDGRPKRDKYARISDMHLSLDRKMGFETVVRPSEYAETYTARHGSALW